MTAAGIRRIAPSHRCGRSITRASLLPARGEDVFACSPTASGLEASVSSGSRGGCGALLGSRPFRSLVDRHGFLTQLLLLVPLMSATLGVIACRCLYLRDAKGLSALRGGWP
jgi:hypothetical protein